jgi:hypothetical protein
MVNLCEQVIEDGQNILTLENNTLLKVLLNQDIG